VIVSDAMWYPLWDRQQVDSTTQGLAKFIGDRFKIGSNTTGPAPIQAVGSHESPSPSHGALPAVSAGPDHPSSSSPSQRLAPLTQSGRYSSPTRPAAGFALSSPTQPAAYSTALSHTGNNSNNGDWDGPSTLVPPGYSVIPTRDLHMHELWEVLTKPRNQLATGKVWEIFEELGIESASSLVQCNEEDLQRLAGCLKKIPRAVFFSKVIVP
jgi:hypothetical protein